MAPVVAHNVQTVVPVVVVGTVGVDLEVVAGLYQGGHTQGQGTRLGGWSLTDFGNASKRQQKWKCMKGGNELPQPVDRAARFCVVLCIHQLSSDTVNCCAAKSHQDSQLEVLLWLLLLVKSGGLQNISASR